MIGHSILKNLLIFSSLVLLTHYNFAKTYLKGIAIKSPIMNIAYSIIMGIAYEGSVLAIIRGMMMATNQIILYVSCSNNIGENFSGERKPSIESIANATKTLLVTPAINGSSKGNPNRETNNRGDTI